MDPRWLWNAYLVADEEGGAAVFVDSGAPVEPLLHAAREGPSAAANFDGKGKAWVRFDDGSDALVGGSRVERR
jgi:hypothetical protein